MEQEQQNQEGAATIIIRNQTQYQDDKQVFNSQYIITLESTLPSPLGSIKIKEGGRGEE